MPSTVHLHVGAPKTGTTYLQSRLSRNQRELKSHGVTYPMGGFRDPRAHYYAALEVTGTDHGVDSRHVDGAWGRLLRRVRQARGGVVVSHELFAMADHDQAARVLADLTATGAEVHIVLTARDLARQLSSGWQEALKFGSTLSFAAFVERARQDRHRLARSFDPTRVLSVWGDALPAERLHLVTVPRSGAPQDVLWRRYLDALAVLPEWAPREAEQENASVGIPEAQLLRRLNRRLGPEVQRGGRYSDLVNGVLVPQVLARRDSPRISVGPRDAEWVAARGEEWSSWLRDRGPVVHGDLDDLRPLPVADDWADPDAPRPGQVTVAALDLVETLLTEVEDTRTPARRLRSLASRFRD